MNCLAYSAKAHPMIPMWCLYCNELPDRRVATEKHFADHGLKNMNWWRAIHARTWELESSFADAKGHKLSPGKVGCTISHWNLKQHLFQIGVEEALVFEDDVCLCENFSQRFAELYANLPSDWEWVYVGWHKHIEANPIVVPGHDLVGTNYYPWGTFAFLLRRSALLACLAYETATREPNDLTICKRILPHLKTYVAMTPLAVDRSQLTGEWQTSLA